MLTLAEVNSLDYDIFVEKFGNIIEHCPVLAAALWKYRPFHSTEDLMDKMSAIVKDLPLSVKEGILRVHPDLAGKIAQAGQLTNESAQEQTAADLHAMTKEDKRLMDQLNKRYRAKFGFPFVICARENKKDAILAGLEQRCNNGQIEEIRTGIAEVLKICNLRVKDIITSTALGQQNKL